MTGGNTKEQQKKSFYSQQIPVNDIFYKHVVELTPDAIVVHSGGKILYANQATFKLMEATSEQEIIGQSVMKFIHKDSLPLIKSRIEKMLSKHKVAPFVEEKFINLKGKIIIA